MSIILGIDAGLAATGYGIIRAEGNKHFHIAHGTITTEPGGNEGSRLLVIQQQLDKIIEQYRPDEAGVETLYFAKNVKTALPVAEARGVILVTLAKQMIPSHGYTPLEVKQAVVGRGRAEKRQIQEMVRLILGLKEPPKPDHAADALAIAICHYHYSHRSRILAQERKYFV